MRADTVGDGGDAESRPALHVSPLAPHILLLEVKDPVRVEAERMPYVEEPGDRLEPGSRTMPAWTPEGIALAPKETRVLTGPEDAPVRRGSLYRPRGTGDLHLWRERTVGAPLPTEGMDDPARYRLERTRAPDEAAIRPQAVFRKTQMAGENLMTDEKHFTHRLHLVLPAPLNEGETYRVWADLPGIGEVYALFHYDPQRRETEAIHVNQIGYRADDSFKRAFLSYWMGAGGGVAYAPETFYLLDAASGERVYEGRVSGSFPADRAERISGGRNQVQADVWYLDFHDMKQSGTFRVHVPGVGVSGPFKIGEATWSAAFRTAMHGFLSHRSGIELGPPFTNYRRPRNMHPNDGFRIFKIPYTMLEGEADIVGQAILEKLEKGDPPEDWPTHAEAWGGYMDAGDWDRRSPHLGATRHLLELFTLNAAFFETFRLDLPPEEHANGIPGLLNEAIWNAAFFRRLQDADGGVRGGVESTEHPRPGVASWEESLVLGVFAPDPASSYSYAATAALLATVLAPYDPEEADAYAVSARRAWDWAEEHALRVLDEAQARRERLPPDRRWRFDRNRAEADVAQMRFLAAGALFELTGEVAFHTVFAELFAESQAGADEVGAWFRYARLPSDRGDAVLREAVRTRILELADEALRFGEGNAFGLHSHSPDLPIMGYTAFYSVPEAITGPTLPRAYVLTGDERYLRGALHAAHFSAGANPLNMTFTTGVGARYPQNPLHLDSRVTGQPAPRGITIYGPSDPGGGFAFSEWVHQWHLQGVVPESRTWPAAEGHVDLFLWPAMSEYTIHQTFRPMAYYWGFLAARHALAEKP